MCLEDKPLVSTYDFRRCCCAVKFLIYGLNQNWGFCDIPVDMLYCFRCNEIGIFMSVFEAWIDEDAYGFEP